MINEKHLYRVSMAWVSIVYVVCYLGVMIFPSLRVVFMRYAMHTDMAIGSNIAGFWSFIAGLIIWNVLVLVGVWLFVYLSKKIKQ